VEYSISDPKNTSHNATEDIQDVFVFPTSFAQQRLWFLDQLEPGTAAYNVPLALRLRGPLNIPILQASLQDIVDRHEILRTTFGLGPEGPVQRIAAHLWLEIPVLDLRALAPEEREAQALHYAQQAAQEPFDLQRGPLLRLLLLQLHEEEFLFALVVHHIITDGWSQSILLHELTQAYTWRLQGQPCQWEPLPLQYADYAVWQRTCLQGERLAVQERYWQQCLRDAPTVLDLPTDHPRPAIQRYQGATVRASLPAELGHKLQHWSQQEGVTLFMCLLAGWALLLGRMSGQQQMLIGTAVAGRKRREVERLIGFFANTLALRLDITGRPTVRELLQRVRKVTLQAYEYQDMPFERVVDLLQPERDLSRSPLVQVVFVLDNTPDLSMYLPHIEIEVMELETQTAKFDLMLTAAMLGEQIEVRLEYDRKLYEQESMQRLLRRYKVVLASMLAHPEERIDRLAWFEAQEWQQVVATWNSLSSPSPQAPCVLQRIWDHAQHTPERVAVVEGERHLTYGQLLDHAQRLAERLRQLGVGPERLVGVCLPRSLELIVGLLAVWQAGAAYVPLDPSYPPQRLHYMLQDAGVVVVLTQVALQERVSAGEGQVILLDGLLEEVAAEPEGQEGQDRGKGWEPEVDGQHLAYVIYTSGSTGQPKGVQVTRSSIDMFLAYMQRELNICSSDVLVAITTFSFDIAALEMFAPLAVGACIVVARSEEVSSGAKLAELMRRVGATIMQATPVTWHMLLNAGWKGSRQLRALCGGEALSQDLAENLLPRVASLCNMYGPTETTVWSVLHHVDSVCGPVPIGRPIANTQCYVLDDTMQPVPPGVPGELYIGGAGVARGYWKRGDLTAERFVPDPFSGRPGSRLYRTGDRVRYLNNGLLEFLGRLDYQVKLRGYRIELGEIESLLARQPGVQAAVALLREDIAGEKRLIAYVEGRQEDLPTQEAMKTALRQQLPAYMVPASIIVLDTLPLTPNGKINRKALPAPDNVRPELEVEYTPPGTPVEEMLAQIWRDVLNLKEVGIHDNFFALGGDSMQCMQVVTRANAQGLQLSSKQIFQYQTIAKLAAILTESATKPKATAGIEAEHRRNSLPAFALVELDEHELEKISRVLESADG
jgi:amino acid adenylation domain-containing protein